MDGVLGGFANVNEPDISCSEDFLKILLSGRFPHDAGRQPLVALGNILCSLTNLPRPQKKLVGTNVVVSTEILPGI